VGFNSVFKGLKLEPPLPTKVLRSKFCPKMKIKVIITCNIFRSESNKQKKTHFNRDIS
jgi:hypothetical protein